MGLLSPRELTVTPEQNRLIASHHEAGHVHAFQKAGYRVRAVWLDGSGGHVGGETDVADDIRAEIGYLAAILAGWAAAAEHFQKAHRLSRSQALTAAGSRSDQDQALFRKHARGVSERQAWKHAERLVRADWSSVTALAERLARKGRLTF